MGRRGVLIVDHQNLIGRSKDLGMEDFEPDWLIDAALRITDCDAFILVTDLTVVNPITKTLYLYEAERWSNAGFRIVHMPPRRIHLPANGGEAPAGETNGNRYRCKDMTDGGIHAEIRHWSQVPQLTDILLFTHDVDFAQDLLWVATGTGKRSILLHVGIENLASALRKAPDLNLNVLGPLAAYSAKALDDRRFWHPDQDAETLGQIVWKTIIDPKDQARNLSLMRRLADVQELIRYLALDLMCVSVASMPGARSLTRHELHGALLDYMAPGKFGSVGYERMRQMDPKPLPYQVFASAINRILAIWLENHVLSCDKADSTVTDRKFHVNFDHPAVALLLGTDFIEDA